MTEATNNRPSLDQEVRAERKRKILLFLLCFGLPLAYLVVFMIIPYLNILQFSFWKKELYTSIPDFNWDNYARVWQNPLYKTVIFNSLETATWVTVFANLLGYPLAYYLVFVAKRHRALLYFLVIAPLWISFLLRTFIWKLILGRSGLVNETLMQLGLIEEPLSIFLYNQFSVVLTLTYIFIPFVALPVYSALEKIPTEYLEASMDLGANRLLTFLKVTLPLSLPGVISGSIFTFCLSFGDFVTPTLIGGANNIMIGNIIISQFGAAFDWPFGSALAVIVLILVMTVVTGATMFERREKGSIT